MSNAIVEQASVEGKRVRTHGEIVAYVQSDAATIFDALYDVALNSGDHASVAQIESASMAFRKGCRSAGALILAGRCDGMTAEEADKFMRADLLACVADGLLDCREWENFRDSPVAMASEATSSGPPCLEQ